jgi:transcriptional regulator NrdR family protein
MILDKDSFAKVMCPECEHDYLQVNDIRSELDVDIIERKIYCLKCGGKNYLRLRRPL